MKLKKHILVLTPGFPKSENDSTCIPPLQALIRELQNNYGHEIKISVVAFQYPFAREAYLWNQVTCWPAGGKNAKGIGKIKTWFRVAGIIKRLHKLQPVNIVHSFWLHDCTLFGQWVAKFTGARHLAHAMGQDVISGNPYMKLLQQKEIHIIANSPFSAALLLQNFKLIAHAIIPFGILPIDFPNFGNSIRKVDMLSVGSLTKIKNHKLFVAIFSELIKSFPSLTGSIIGEGPLSQQLQEQICRLGLQNNLKIEGVMSRSEVLIRMTESKILLHTAPFESAGYVFLEALYSGMQVVSFHTGFLPDVQNAFPCRDKNEMIEKILMLLNQNQKNGRAEVPTITQTAKAIYNLY